MNKTLTALAITAVLAGCSSTKTVTNGDEPIRNQKLSTSFVAEGVKIETSCAWYKPWKSDCDIIAIEATGVAATNGNSTNNLRTGLMRAEMQAKANVSHFITEEVTSNRVTTTIAKNIEKAQDKINKGAADGQTVEMTDQEAKNVSVRENANDTAHNLTNTIRTNSRSILRGFKVASQDITGDQEVKVVVRWDLESDRAANMLRKKFQ
jgi:hypothetical protein